MDALPEVVLSAALAYCDCAALVAVEAASRHLRHVVQAQGLWATLARRDVVLNEHEAPASPLQWKRLVHVVSRPVDASNTTKLLEDVTGWSSMDRPDESPLNTLTRSRCWIALNSFPDSIKSSEHIFIEMGRRVQYRCNCMIGQSCYWSSTGSTDQNAQDFVDYTVAEESLVYLLEVIPYQAFWHPQSPTYSPRAVSFQFYTLRSASTTERVLLYESPAFPLENKMKLNQFTLPRPLWLPNGGIMRLNLHGRHQAQTVDMPNAPAGNVPHYYSCLSYVSADGMSAVNLLPPPLGQRTAS